MDHSLSIAEENYLKAIQKLSDAQIHKISTNDIANMMNIAAPSVSDMLKKLAQKKMISYEKYYGVKLTKQGEQIAFSLIRKHRLWEVFLTQKLNFAWDEVHDIAEQLEHIKSDDLINRLEKFLGSPKYDPHGDPIPDAKGQIQVRKQIQLNELKKNEKAVIVGVKDTGAVFLQFLDSIQLSLGTKVQMKNVIEFDQSIIIKLSDNRELMLSHLVSQNIFVSPA
ncbi:MAG: metal-dependent transcriptional regulator [Bacteroidota bacterium]